MTRAQALAELRNRCAADTDPALSNADLSALLDGAGLAVAWAAETDYAVGARVVTTGRNGRLYRCIQSGESDTTEPDWGPDPDTFRGQLVLEGTGVMWQDEGPAPPDLWDLDAAAAAGWRWKAARCSDRTYFATNGQMFSRQQVHAQCLAMADRYAPIVIA